jgi:zinc/manganese transport system substrate-binding protein
MRIVLILVFGVLALWVGCGEEDGAGDRVDVVATTTQAYDFVRAVGAGRVEAHRMLPPGADPHDYEPRPSDVRALSRARLVVRSGGELDEWLDDVLEDAGGDAEEVTLLEAAGGGNPHFWLDPRRAVAAVEAVRAALSRVDPGGRSAYGRRARSYAARLRRLDREIAACLRVIPERRRKIVATHDSLDPFARRYGIELAGTVLASRSTEAQPSARDVDRLVERIRREEVPALFPESSVDTKLERAVAREAGVEVAEPLLTDSLGREGSTARYVGAMQANARAIADGLRPGTGRSCFGP